MVHEDGETSSWDDEKLCSEGVVIGVVCGSELEEYEVAGGQDGGNEHHLHHSVVHRDKVGGQVKVASDEDQHKHHLALPRYSCSEVTPQLLPTRRRRDVSPAQDRVLHILARSRKIASR